MAPSSTPTLCATYCQGRHIFGDPHLYAHPSNFIQAARCRVCAQVYDSDRFVDVGYCPRHAVTSSDEEARLGQLAVRLQDSFMPFCRTSRLQRGRLAPEAFTKQHCRSPAEKRWMEWIALFVVRCEDSLFELSDPLLDVLHRRIHLGIIHSLDNGKSPRHDNNWSRPQPRNFEYLGNAFSNDKGARHSLRLPPPNANRIVRIRPYGRAVRRGLAFVVKVQCLLFGTDGEQYQ